MKILFLSSTGQPISLVEELAQGGEGSVWRTNQPGLVAKLYQQPTPERFKKLEVMVANPPIDPTKAQNHTSIVWPKDLLKDNQGAYQGFVMPSIPQGKELPKVYTPKLRKAFAPEFNWQYLHTTAQNLALTVQAIHDGGYVLGDINPRNILVNRQALPSVIDTDSFQVQDPKNGKLYRCTVGMAEFTPPELINQDFSTLSQTPLQDHFRLGIIIYYLLFGDHPFKGKWMGEGDSPDPIASISRGLWPYGSNRQMVAGPLHIPLEVVHPALKDCFLECFNAGHGQPDRRPTARDWYAALAQASSDLKVCSRNKNHYYARHYGKCCWCERGQTLNFDIFALPNTPATAQVSNISKTASSTRPVSQSSPQAIASASAQTRAAPNIVPSLGGSRTPPTKLFSIMVATTFSAALLYFIYYLVSLIFLTSPGVNYLNRGQVYEKSGNTIKALEDYNQALKIDPKYAYAYVKRGNLYQKMGSNKKALEDYSQAIKLNPKYAFKYQNRASLYQNSRDDNKALKNYDWTIKMHPNDAKAYLKRGNLYQEIGDKIQALDDYNQALKLNPENADTYLKRGKLYQEMGDKIQAIEDYNQVLKLNPKKADAYLNRGLAYQSFGELKKALADYDQALKLAPKYAYIYNNRGKAYKSIGEHKKALADYNQALKLEPKYAEAYNNRGELYRILGEKTKALQDLNQALTLDPEFSSAYVNRGIIYDNSGDNSRALIDYDQAINFDPKNAAAYTNRGIAYEKLGYRKKAIEDYKRAVYLDHNRRVDFPLQQ
jgi:tetratricopeptide (TPR) repeat protein